jgi:hypothetical protein
MRRPALVHNANTLLNCAIGWNVKELAPFKTIALPSAIWGGGAVSGGGGRTGVEEITRLMS